MTADRPGRAFDSAGQGRHAMEAASNPHREAKRAFARQLADYLHGEAQAENYDRLVLLAPAPAMGDLRAALSDMVAARVRGELVKDLTQVRNDELPEHLNGVFAL